MVANATPVFLRTGHPLDFGKKFSDGRRILGDGKTWEGLLIGIWFGTTVACVEAIVLNSLKYYEYGLLASIGGLLGDVISSFFKRRLGLERGAPLPLVDQLDFYFGATLMMMVAGWMPRWDYVLWGVIIIVVLHKLTNVIAYYLNLKDVPW